MATMPQCPLVRMDIRTDRFRSVHPHECTNRNNPASEPVHNRGLMTRMVQPIQCFRPSPACLIGPVTIYDPVHSVSPFIKLDH